MEDVGAFGKTFQQIFLRHAPDWAEFVALRPYPVKPRFSLMPLLCEEKMLCS